MRSQRTYTLSRREMDVLRLVVAGLTSDEIAERLNISPSTVKNHRRSVLNRLDARTMPSAVAAAMRQGLIE